MPMLTRRRAPDTEHTWLVHFGDIHIGTIAQRSGVPGMVDQWGWTIGFYPASHRGVRADGTAKTFDQARADFEVAWHRLQPELTKEDFVEHRQHRAFDAWKRAMWDQGHKLPTRVTDGKSRCFCGATIEIENVAQHVYGAHMMLEEIE